MTGLQAGDVLLVRHARAAGQAPHAPLTAEGQQQARDIASVLTGLGVTRLVSSPWLRAVHTAQPLAGQLDLPVMQDERLTERVLSGRDLRWWRAALKVSFALPFVRWPGGESGRAARARVRAALAEHADPHGVTVCVTHGNLMALALGLSFSGWADLRNPDVWLLRPGSAPRRLNVTA